MQSSDTPARLLKNSVSELGKTNPSKAGTVGTLLRLNCFAISYPKPVAPSFGIDNPPVATTKERAVKEVSEVLRLILNRGPESGESAAKEGIVSIGNAIGDLSMNSTLAC